MLDGFTNALSGIAEALGIRHDKLLSRLEAIAHGSSEAQAALRQEFSRSLATERILRIAAITVLLVLLALGGLVKINPRNVFADEPEDHARYLASHDRKLEYTLRTVEPSGEVSLCCPQGALGTLTGIGRDCSLALAPAKDECEWRAFLSEFTSPLEVGKTVLDHSVATLVPKEQQESPYRLGRVIAFPGSHLCCEITRTEMRNDPDGAPRAVYSVRFGERNAHSNTVAWNTPFEVVKSDNGLVRQAPSLLWNEAWDSMYVVTIGVGRSPENDPSVVYKVNSVAHEFAYHGRKVLQRYLDSVQSVGGAHAT